MSRLDIALPPDVPPRWDVEGVDLANRELLGQDSDGTRRYRLKFARDYADAFRLKVRYRLAYPGALDPPREVGLRVSMIRVLEGSSIGQNVRVYAEPGIEIKSEAKGWALVGSRRISSASIGPPAVDGPLPLSRADDKPGPVAILARLGPRAWPVPGFWWSPGSWISDRSSGPRVTWRPRPRSGLKLATASMTLGLPPGARWIRSRIGCREAFEGEVEVVRRGRVSNPVPLDDADRVTATGRSQVMKFRPLSPRSAGSLPGCSRAE